MLAKTHIREIDWHDLPAIMSIEQASHILAWPQDHFHSALRSNNVCWCIEQAGKLRAYCILLPAVDNLEILNITVAPDDRRQGYARQLLNAASQYARAHGLQQLLLEVRQSNHIAQLTYQQFGFIEISRRHNYYPLTVGREDAVVMAYPITP
ncbi:MAG: ribosomal protein S18-alanine N-acetyltransferase [Ottowia sp.]|nr:ribosomal protein S18-alanine N-acetyltransferase [Ottowia sp.]